ncbi:hypothetical protein KDA00_02240 [Candidatus Saccharibacteria bacterium]|nr:hypothetical protein [Candidatus Saccharibacteria bacterium]
MAKSKREMVLEKEIENLRLEIEQLKKRRMGGIIAVFRTIAIWVLVILCALSINLAVAAGWVRQNIVDSNKWVENTTIILKNESVQNDIAAKITDELFTATDAESIVQDFLPEKAQALSQPLTTSLKSFTQQQVKSAVASEEFQNKWKKLSQNAHEGIISSLENGGNKPTNSDEYVIFIDTSSLVLNLKPVITNIKDRLANNGLSFVNKLPTDLINSQIALAEINNMPTILASFNTLNRASRALLLIAIVSGAAALGLSYNKRRTVIGVSVSIITLMVLNVQLIYFTRLPLAQGITQNANAVSPTSTTAIFDTLMSGLIFYNRVVLFMAFTVLVVAVLSGPTKFAQFVRSQLRRLGKGSDSPLMKNFSDNAYTYVSLIALVYSLILLFGPKNTVLSLGLLVAGSFFSLWLIAIRSNLSD